MTKRYMAVLFACIMIVLSLVGCGSHHNTRSERDQAASSTFSDHSEKTVSSSKSESSSSYSSSQAESVKEESAPLVEEKKLMELSEAWAFQNGVAWVKSKSDYKWNIIDSDGNIVKEFTDIYSIVTNFIGGFSIVETSDSKQIIDSTGEIVLDFDDAGYKKVYSYDGMKDGSIVVVKNIDTFEKSGDYFYHYDLNSKTEKEICPCSENYNSYYLLYVGNGYYVKTNSGEGSAYNNSDNKIEIEFSNYITNDTVSFKDDKTITEAFKSDRDPEISSWKVTRVGDYIFLSINPKSGSEKGFIADLENKNCKALGDLNGQKISEYSVLEVDIDSKDDIYDNMALIRKNYKEFYCYDFANEKYVEFAPKCDYECSLVDYENNRFLVTARNDNGTEFFTVVDWEMKPLFTPKRYSKTTSLLENYVITDEESGSVSITDISSDNKVIKEISDSNITYIDKTNFYVWVATKGGKTECYDIKTGDQISTLSGEFEIYSDFDSGYSLVKNKTDYSLNYAGTESSYLEIVEDIIYTTAKSSDTDSLISKTSSYTDSSSKSKDSLYEDLYSDVDIDDIFGSPNSDYSNNRSKGTGSNSHSNSSSSLDSGLDILKDNINPFNLVSELIDMLGNFGKVICVIGLAVGLLGCFLGFKLTKVFIGICGFFTGLSIGTVIAVAKNNAKFMLLALILAIVFVVFSYKLYKFGVFIISFLNGTVVGFVIGLLIFREIKPAIIAAVIIGLIVGIISAVFTKPTIIISTSVSFGEMSGTFLALLLSSSVLSYILPIAFIAAGIFVQIRTNGGLFDGTAQKIVNNASNNNNFNYRQ